MSKSVDHTYADMMVESLRKKKSILSKLYSNTEEQEELLKSDDMNVDRFTEITEEKGKRIDELNDLDSGFDNLYRKLEQELTVNRGAYHNEIEEMKSLINEITDLSTKIQVVEKRNYERFQNYMKGEREKLKVANASQQTAMSYAKNMSGSHKPGNSYFVNETK